MGLGLYINIPSNTFTLLKFSLIFFSSRTIRPCPPWICPAMVWGVQGYSTYWRCYSPTKSYPTLWVKCYVVIIIKKAREFIKHLYWGIELGADIFWDTIIFSHVVVILSQNLAGNDLGSRGAKLISDSLRKNRTITKLNISGNAVLTLYSVHGCKTTLFLLSSLIFLC